MTVRICAALAAILAVSELTAARAGFSALGLVNTGAGLANNTVDANWTVAVSPTSIPAFYNSTTTVVDRAGFPLFQGWAPTNTPGATGGSKWLTATSAGFDINSTDQNVFTHQPNATFTYITTFVMPTNAILANVQISGRYWADDFLTGIVVNGTTVFSATSNGFGQFAESGQGSGNIGFSLPSTAFTTGTNTIAFAVLNGNGQSDNPTGFRLEFDSRRVETRDPTTAAVPVPPTLVAAGLGLVGLVVRRRRTTG